MTMLVSLPQAKDHLRIDSADGDADLTLKVHAASGAVLRYLNGKNYLVPTVDGQGAPVLDAGGAPTTEVRFEVQAAVLLMTGYLHKDRDNDQNHEYETGYLPRPVTALLYGLRDPALA